jgi:hypothetical protein
MYFGALRMVKDKAEVGNSKGSSSSTASTSSRTVLGLVAFFFFLDCLRLPDLGGVGVGVGVVGVAVDVDVDVDVGAAVGMAVGVGMGVGMGDGCVGGEVELLEVILGTTVSLLPIVKVAALHSPAESCDEGTVVVVVVVAADEAFLRRAALLDIAAAVHADFILSRTYGVGCRRL